MRIGIPGSLLYFLYYPTWNTFFRELGAQVISSGKTTREMLDLGVKEALADACVPVKLYFGHVQALARQVDYLFIPRVVCLNKETTYCPKFLGLPDMIRHSLKNVPEIIDTRMDVREGWNALAGAYDRAGRALGAPVRLIRRAFQRAMAAERQFFSLLQEGWQPAEAMQMLEKGIRPGEKPPEGNPVFAVLGYPYIVHDQYISVGLLARLKKMGIGVITVENLPPKVLSRINLHLDKRLFWTLGDLVLRAHHFFLRQKTVDGVIHLTAFGCGPDSLVDKFMEMAAREHPDVPFMSLSVDEHSGEAGLATRLEAFADMVKRKRCTVSAQGNFPPRGRILSQFQNVDGRSGQPGDPAPPSQ
ncbi:acyl-CoA dehydratase activase-related protein [Desulfofundulus thermobenzoicus]|uniref:acyl-CoA dehydratase activase-related protein n=1 Tax=Desulfofundulus thermobenzoicus TaxID=29376 RepID=UPI00311A999F